MRKLCIIFICAAAAAMLWLVTPKDMSGSTFAEIEEYSRLHPRKKIVYALMIDEGLTIDQTTTQVSLQNDAQARALAANAAYMAPLCEINTEAFPISLDALLLLQESFPDATLTCGKLSALGTELDYHTAELDLCTLPSEQLGEASTLLRTLPDLEQVWLEREQGTSSIPLTDAYTLYQARPNVTWHYSANLFGQLLTTETERVEYFRTDNGDEGLEQLRMMLPMMHRLTYLRLDQCGTSNEAMAALRDEYAHRFPVVWRVFMGKYDMLTDTYKIWANYITEEESKVLQYCTEVRYMDIGHSRHLETIDFVKNMPHLQVCVLSDCLMLSSIAPLQYCTELEYLEIYDVADSDLTPLSALTNLEHLNISRLDIHDLRALDGLTKLQRLWATSTEIPEAELQHFKDLHPNCQVVTEGHPALSLWRWYNRETKSYVPRYALLREQIGYGINDQSIYPRGYLTHEITYESTGIRRPQ